MQVSAIIACVPCSATFDYTAGAAFGFFPGIVMVILSKGTAAILSFLFVTTLSNSPVGCWVQQRARSGSGDSRWAMTTKHLQESVKQGGLRFCILLRLSPLPSWVANYVLPLTGVTFPVYLISTIGMAPPLLANVYQGYAAASIACALHGQEGCWGKHCSMVLVVLTTCQWLMGLVLAQQMAKFAIDAQRIPGTSASTLHDSVV
jgi:uncharacterized membrane protein YdjX (TVP38/TMEM64 family)